MRQVLLALGVYQMATAIMEQSASLAMGPRARQVATLGARPADYQRAWPVKFKYERGVASWVPMDLRMCFARLVMACGQRRHESTPLQLLLTLPMQRTRTPHVNAEISLQTDYLEAQARCCWWPLSCRYAGPGDASTACGRCWHRVAPQPPLALLRQRKTKHYLSTEGVLRSACVAKQARCCWWLP